MAKPRQQIAALPLKWTKSGKLRVLLVTSRETRRWIAPKGWPMNGKKPWRAAEIEALEEAGVKGKVSVLKIGTYEYKKKLSSGRLVRCSVDVYPMVVKKEKERWLERDQRKRKWFSPRKAAQKVTEPELRSVLKSLSKKKTSRIVEDIRATS